MSYSFIQIPVFLRDGLNNPQYLQIRNDYLKLTNKPEFIGGMPVTLENHCFKQLIRVDSTNRFVYNITLKVDGERYLLFLSSWGELYFIDRLLNFFIFLKDSEPLNRINTQPFLIDGELVNNNGSFEFLIFDLLFYENQSFINFDYYERYKASQHLLENVLFEYLKMYNYSLGMSLKIWFPITDIIRTDNIYNFIVSETNKTRSKNIKLKADGLILQPFDTEYVTYGPWNNYNNVQFKWKPIEDQTIDFRIKILSETRWDLIIKSGVPFTMPNSGLVAVCKPTKADREMFKDGDVAEFSWVSGNEFKILRPRPNKEPNGITAVMSVLNYINDPFTLDILKEPLNIMTGGSTEGTGSKKKNQSIRILLKTLSRSELTICALVSKNGIFFNKYETKMIGDIYSKFVYSNELECRIFKNGKSTLSVDRFTFMYLYEYLSKNFETIHNPTIDIIEYSDDKLAPKNRSSYKSVDDITNRKSIVNEQKKMKQFFVSKQEKKNLYNNLLFKLSLSEEIKTNNIIGLKKITREKPSGHNNTIRLKNRFSFKISDLWLVDLTIVKMGYTINDANSKNDTYEIECEFIGEKVSFEHFIKSFSNIYMFILAHTSYC